MAVTVPRGPLSDPPLPTSGERGPRPLPPDLHRLASSSPPRRTRPRVPGGAAPPCPSSARCRHAKCCRQRARRAPRRTPPPTERPTHGGPHEAPDPDRNTVARPLRGRLRGRHRAVHDREGGRGLRCAANVGRPVGERPIVRETERHVTRDQAERGDPPGPSGLTTGRRDPRILAPETSTRTHRPNRKRTQGMESPVASPTRPPRGGMGVPSLSKSGEGRTPDRNSGMRSWRHPGVSGWACGEGRPKEGGRSRRVPGTVAPSKQTVHGGRDDIRAHPERSPSVLREVGRDHSTEESSVMEADGKGPYFGAAPEGQRDCPSPREG